MKKLLSGISPWIPYISVSTLFLVALVHVTHFDHWGSTLGSPLYLLLWCFKKVADFITSSLNMDLAHAVMYIGWVTLQGAILILSFVVAHEAGFLAPRKLYRGYFTLVLLCELWFAVNPNIMLEEFEHRKNILSMVPSALFLGAFSGLYVNTTQDSWSVRLLARWNILSAI